ALSALQRPDCGILTGGIQVIWSPYGLVSLMRFLAFFELTGDGTCARSVASTETRWRATLANSSRDGYSAVDRQNLARDHARFVTGEIKCHAGDIVRLDQTEQVRVSKLRQRGVSGNQLFHSLGHRR